MAVSVSSPLDKIKEKLLVFIYKSNLLFVYSLIYRIQEVPFNTTFYESPVVLVSVHHQYDRQAKSFVPPENNIITAWVEVWYYQLSYFRSTRRDFAMWEETLGKE